jgi:transposase
LEEKVRLLKHKRFAASSAKSDGQAELFNEAEAAEPVPEDDLEENTGDAETETILYERRKSRGRKPIPADLPRVRIEHDLSVADKVCECGCALTHIGEDTSEQLDIIPAKIQVLQHARLKHPCKACESTVRTTALAMQAIPKSNASPGLLAYIATAKYQDALLLHRQENIFKRIKVDIPRNTLANWMMRSGELITPSCYMTMPRAALAAWRRNGSRVLVVTCKPMIMPAITRLDAKTTLAMWGAGHAPRKLIDAQKAATSKDKKTARTGNADVAINYIAKLYAIEKQAKDTCSEARRQLRQEKRGPILNALREWLDKTLHSTLPKGLLGTALGYLNRNWEKLIRYTEDGDVNIDNNRAENAIRPFVKGRKNWLFSATPRGAMPASRFIV